jgi:hypothetical protein
MKRSQAKELRAQTDVVNKKIKDCEQAITGINENSLERIISNEWYTQEDISLIGKLVLLRNEFDFNYQFEVVGSADQLKLFLNKFKEIDEFKKIDLNAKPIFIIFNISLSENIQHWYTIVIFKHMEKIFVLFKDSLGSELSNDFKNAINWIFAGNKVEFKSHLIKEQEDGNSCGPMALQNMQIIINYFKTDKQNLLNSFGTIAFCQQKDIESVKKRFLQSIQEEFSKSIAQSAS